MKLKKLAKPKLPEKLDFENLQAYKAVRKLLGTTSSDALLVDPDAAGKLLADFAILAPERATVRVLADEARYKPSLITGIHRWQLRFGSLWGLLPA